MVLLVDLLHFLVVLPHEETRMKFRDPMNRQHIPFNVSRLVLVGRGFPSVSDEPTRAAPIGLRRLYYCISTVVQSFPIPCPTYPNATNRWIISAWLH